MQRHATKPAPDVPKWSALLVEAVNKPGLIMEAYSAFHNYSIGNQILALVQCQVRGLEPGPINTFPGLRRHMSCDWGELSEDDIAENQLSLEKGFRLLSNYQTGKGQQLWIITEADRSATTVLLASEY